MHGASEPDMKSDEGPGWVQVLEDLGRAMARKHGSRFGCTAVFTGGLRAWQGRRWRVANSRTAVAMVGGARDLSGVGAALCFAPYENARNQFPGAGSTILAMI